MPAARAAKQDGKWGWVWYQPLPQAPPSGGAATWEKDARGCPGDLVWQEAIGKIRKPGSEGAHRLKGQLFQPFHYAVSLHLFGKE